MKLRDRSYDLYIYLSGNYQEIKILILKLTKKKPAFDCNCYYYHDFLRENLNIFDEFFAKFKYNSNIMCYSRIIRRRGIE